MRDGIASQRDTLSQTKQSVEDVFGLMKIANLLFLLVIISMFSILSINSIAGLI